MNSMQTDVIFPAFVVVMFKVGCKCMRSLVVCGGFWAKKTPLLSQIVSFNFCQCPQDSMPVFTGVCGR